MEEKEYALHDVVEMKKPHPCGVNQWNHPPWNGYPDKM